VHSVYSGDMLSDGQVNFLNTHTQGKWSLNLSTWRVDIEGNFSCSYLGLGKSGFGGIQFGRVTGSFYCRSIGLESLADTPTFVGGQFDCSNNMLQSLVGSPEGVEDFYCNNNSLSTLEGAPRTVRGDFFCQSNDLTSLTGAPDVIGKSFVSDAIVVSESNVFDPFGIYPSGQWAIADLVRIWRELHERVRNGMVNRKSFIKSRDLLGTLVSPEVLQVRIDANPERAAVELKSIVHLPEYKNLKWPESLKTEVDLLSDLDSVGL